MDNLKRKYIKYEEHYQEFITINNSIKDILVSHEYADDQEKLMQAINDIFIINDWSKEEYESFALRLKNKNEKDIIIG